MGRSPVCHMTSFCGLTGCTLLLLLHGLITVPDEAFDRSLEVVP